MEEKFYYSRLFVWLGAVSLLVMLVTGIMMYLVSLSEWLGSQRLGGFLDFALGLLMIFISVAGFGTIVRPAIIITDRNLILSPLSTKTNRKPYFSFRTLKLGFEQIVSASIKDMITTQFGKADKVIEIRFRRPSGKEGSFYIFISKISRHERLIDILKQRIKFQ